MSGFAEFSFDARLARNIAHAGYVTPTPIQKQAIPHALAGTDILGLAQTGTGKTAAFVLPLLQRLASRDGGKPHVVRALVIAPTRELAEQIHQVTTTFAKELRLKSATIYGGASMNRQVSALRHGVDIIIACPGRLLDHMQQKTVSLAHVETLVLDEADQMFDMGFLPAIRRIVAALPTARQTMLFSATMPEDIRKLSAQVLKSPVKVELERGPVATISHALYPIAQESKTELLLHILRDAGTGPILVFTKTKHKASRLADQVARAGYATAALQGNLSQNQRQRALDGFRSGKFQILFATDIAARGIDVDNISHIINYDIPATSETYIHRIGRTARATKSGDAYTFVTGEDKGIVRDIEKALGKSIEKRLLDTFDYKGKSVVLSPAAAPGQQTQKRQMSENTRPKGDGKPRRKRFRGFSRS